MGKLLTHNVFWMMALLNGSTKIDWDNLVSVVRRFQKLSKRLKFKNKKMDNPSKSLNRQN